MHHFLILLAIASFSLKIEAQHLLNIRTNNACSYFGEAFPGRVYGFDSSEDAQSIISRITDAVGLKPNFEIRAANVHNAMAYVDGGKRLILYSENFIAQIKNATGTDWAGISVLAHEIGHHLNGHTLTEEGSRPEIELEADEFSGFVLAKMGASLDEAQSALKYSKNANGSLTHPPKSARVEAVTVGWKKGKGKTPSSSENSPNANQTSSDCEEKNRGDLCFENKSNEEVQLEWNNNYGEGSSYLSLQPGDIECLEQLRADLWQITVKKWRAQFTWSDYKTWTVVERKMVPVEKCKSKTLIIR